MEVVLLMLITTTPLVSFLSCAILNIDVPLNVNLNALREKEFRAYCINSCKHILQMGKNDRKCSIPGLYCYFLFSSIFFLMQIFLWCQNDSWIDSLFSERLWKLNIKRIRYIWLGFQNSNTNELDCVIVIPVKTLLHNKSHFIIEYTLFRLTETFQLRAQKNLWS